MTTPNTPPQDGGGSQVDHRQRRAVTLDPAALRPIWQLEASGESGLFAEMLALFRDEGNRRLTELQAALDGRDADQVFRLAHTFKGEALAWGATDLADASRVVEEHARAASLDGLAARIDDLAGLFTDTLDALDAICPRAA
jgi:HPt (histidine-containing phosphotransfer) domain-containing protein